MVQATVCTKDDDDLSGALYAVVLRLSHLPVNERVDKAGLAVLHETRRLGTLRPSDLAAPGRVDDQPSPAVTGAAGNGPTNG